MNQEEKLEALDEAVEVISYCLYEEFSMSRTSDNDQRRYARITNTFQKMIDCYKEVVADEPNK